MSEPIKIDFVNVADLVPYENNSKHHPLEQVTKLASQIKAFGFDVPVVIDEDKVILKGHCRRLAAIQLGLEKVPVIVKTGLSTSEKVALRIADNKVTESTYDYASLKVDLELLKSDGFSLDLTCIDALEIEKIIIPAVDASLPTENETEGNSGEVEKDYAEINLRFSNSEYAELMPVIREALKKSGVDNLNDLFTTVIKHYASN